MFLDGWENNPRSFQSLGRYKFPKSWEDSQVLAPLSVSLCISKRCYWSSLTSWTSYFCTKYSWANPFFFSLIPFDFDSQSFHVSTNSFRTLCAISLFSYLNIVVRGKWQLCLEQHSTETVDMLLEARINLRVVGPLWRDCNADFFLQIVISRLLFDLTFM